MGLVEDRHFFFLPSFFSIPYSRILFRSTECEIYGFTMLSNQFHLVSPSFPLTHLRMALSSYCLCVWFLDWQFLRVFFFLIIKKEEEIFVCLFVYYYYYYYYYYFCVFMFVWYVSNCIWMIFLAIDMSSYYMGPIR